MLADITIAFSGTSFRPQFVTAVPSGSGTAITLADGQNSFTITVIRKDDLNLLLDQMQVEFRHKRLGL